MAVRFCPSDGYPMRAHEQLGSSEVEWECTNPLHPRNPGPCPVCGYAGPHRRAYIAKNPPARCGRCDHEWESFPDESS